MLWYTQLEYVKPTLNFSEEYNPEASTYTLTIAQSFSGKITISKSLSFFIFQLRLAY